MLGATTKLRKITEPEGFAQKMKKKDCSCVDSGKKGRHQVSQSLKELRA